MVLIIIAAVIGCVLIFILLYQVFLGFFQPGDNPVEVTPADEAVTKVTTSKTTLAALISFFAYKVLKACRKSDQSRA